MYRFVIRPVLFLIDAEKVHHYVFSILKFICRIPGIPFLLKAFYFPWNKKPVRIMGIDFPNRVGLAAGFDKNAALFNELAYFGFGHIEIGTVTPLAQPGNEKPRLFRLPEHKALINRMGFNNDGVEAAFRNLNKKRSVIIGGNIGKNKNTLNENALNDYLICFHKLHPAVDYFVVNVSSPNTPGLRQLQEKEPLLKLLNTLQQENLKYETQKPILLKIAPDLTYEQLDEIIEIIQLTGLAGLVIANTTISREAVADAPNAKETGGLSGLPVKEKSTTIIHYVRQKAEKEMTIIGSGGIFNAADAKEKLDAGADLIQVYTGFIYEGPSIVKKICRGI
jgi:dihydroorotate dehydrogenase